MHHRIGHQSNFENILDSAIYLFGHFNKQLVEGFADHCGHFVGTLRVHHHIGDATHQVFAKTNLRIHQTGAGHYLAGTEITEMGSNGGGTHIHGHTIGAISKARPEGNNLLVFVHGHTDATLAFGQCWLQGF